MKTKDELLTIAKSIADGEGWPWVEPVSVVRSRKWFFLGPVYWEVITNAESRGGNVFVMIDDKTGSVVGKGNRPR